MPPNSIYVGRPSPWGNPWKVDPPELNHELAVIEFENTIDRILLGKVTEAEVLGHSKPPFNIRTEAQLRAWLEPLRGKDLVCWCGLYQPCHADYLIKVCKKFGISEEKS